MPEMRLESARELGDSGEADLQRDIGDPLVRRGPEQQRGSLQPDTADMVIQRFTGYRLEDPVKVERRKATDIREPGQRELAVEMSADIVDDTIHSLGMVVTVSHPSRVLQ